MSKDVLRLPIDVPATAIEDAVKSAVKQELSRNDAFYKSQLDDIKETWKVKFRAYESEFDEQGGMLRRARKEIDDDLEALKDRLTKKHNWLGLPVAVIVLLAGILMVWSIVGTVAPKLKDQVEQATEDVGNLQELLENKKQELTTLSQEASNARAQLEDLKKTIPDLAKRTQKIERTLSDNNGQWKALSEHVKALQTRIDAALLRLADQGPERPATTPGESAPK